MKYREKKESLFLVGFTSGAWVLYLLIAVFTAFYPPSASSPPLPQISISQPQNAADVGGDVEVKGTVSNLPKGAVVWIFTVQFLSGETERFWPQRPGAIIPSSDGTWIGRAYFADTDLNKKFEIWAVVADSSINNYLEEYIASVDRGNVVPFLGYPPFGAFLATAKISVTRR